ncbi:MAG: Ig-like domain-containing protein [Acidobacteriota bacterium]|nr:Ig-like domain-containing protein [Acidobacteriota bacterium]MDQ7088833.1 Ig-like domain-containing protein [Acidobacteriota bacterium]
MKASGVMQGAKTAHAGRWMARVALALVLALGVVSWATATATSCGGAETDGGGYSCTKPTLPDMIPDISGTGTAITSWKPKGCSGDDCYALVALGSTFTYYGTAYTEGYVGSNGYLSFGAGYTNEVSAESIPASPNPNNAIYAYGDDLNPSAGGNIYYQATTCTVDRDSNTVNDSCFVVQWNAVPDFDATGTVTVQLALDFATNEALIEIEAETTDAGTPRLVGTENLAGSIGLWYKLGTDTDSRGATAADQFIFSPDNGAPAVSSTTPADNATGVGVSTSVVVNFDEAMDTSSVSLTVLSGTDPGGWSSTWSNSNQTVTYTHAGFSDSDTLALQITGQDVAGNALTNVNNTAATCTSGYCWDFTTVDLTAPSDVSKLTTAATDLSVTAEWAPPADSDLSGFLVLRHTGAPVDSDPVDGTTYLVGDVIGTGNDVVCVTAASGGAVDSCTDNTVTNNQTYYYKVYAYDTSKNYAAGVSRTALPRSNQSYKFSYTTSSSTLAAPGVVANTYIVGTGNDRLLHRMAEATGSRGTWNPPSTGGAVQSRPISGDLDLTPGTDYTSFMSAQNGFLYRFALDGNGATAEGNADAITDAACASGLLQAGPVVMLQDAGNNGITGDQGVIVATRCGATDNKILIYDLALTALQSSYDGGTGGLGISNASPIILYMYTASTKNLVYVPVRSGGGESLVVLAVNSLGQFDSPPYAVITGIGDIDATPAFARRGSNRNDWIVAVGNTAGEIYTYQSTARTGGAGTSLNPVDSYLVATGDGPVKGISISTGVAVSPGYENWLVWTTDNTVHGIKIGTDGSFDTTTYWSRAIAGASVPLVLRGVGGGTATRVYVGSSDGKLYELNAADGSIVSSPTVESGKTIGDPTFDYADGTNQGIVVGTTGGSFHWVVLN